MAPEQLLESSPSPEIEVDLSPRQWEVLGLLALGLKNNEIAEKLGITNHTANSHVIAINSELGGNRTVSAIIAMRNGLVDIPSLRERLGNRSPETLRRQLDNLSPRRKEVTALIGNEGLSNGEIAWRLSLKKNTVSNHVKSILEKLELRNRTEIAIFFFLCGHKLDEEKMPHLEVVPLVTMQTQPAIKEEPVRRTTMEKPSPPTTRRKARRKRETVETREERSERTEEEIEKARQMRILDAILYLTEDGYTPKKIKDIISDY